MAVHGFVRATLEIEILIRTESLEKAYLVVKEIGYGIRGKDISLDERAVDIRRVSKSLGEGEDVLSLDFLLVTPQVEDRLGN